ncbi:MAG: hypothetical protein HYW47_03405 [Deltaproteobacteria bacterium]|nr:hypothetical protein [Deltaproteobacteria bacterium]
MTQAQTQTNCKIEKCSRPVRAKGYCPRHFKKWRKGELPKPSYKICGQPDCRKPLFSKGYCEAHYVAWSKSRKVRKKLEEMTQKEVVSTPTATEEAQ